VEGDDGYRLFLDGNLLIDRWKKESYRMTTVPCRLVKDREHDIRLEFYENVGNARLRLIWDVGIPDAGRKIDEAVSLASRCDAAVIVAGIEEGEFRDRANIGLPGRQEELIRRIAAGGKPVVVVLVGGSAVTMSNWIDDVPAVVEAWYPGEAGGTAVAEVLFGSYSPAGRLPVTFPQSVAQLPLVYNHKPTGRGDDYLDLTGKPLFPFGHGLSYTTFEYSAMEISPEEITPEGSTTVSCLVQNTGGAAGDEVVQMYIRDVTSSTVRPVMELKGFRRISLLPGEAKRVLFRLSSEELSALDQNLAPSVEPGEFTIMIGSSSRDIRLRGTLRVAPGR
jgi:beta-glucosidase